VSDAQILLRDMVGDAATSAANRVNPGEDQLAQIDRPAEDNTWHEAPDLSGQNIKGQLRSQWDKNKPFGGETIDKAAGDAAEAAHPEGQRDPAAVANYAAQQRQQQQQGGIPAGIDAHAGAQAGVSTLVNEASANIPEETKEQQRKLADKSRDYLSKKMPKERREQTIWRLKKMVVECQGHEDCKLLLTIV
jgi:hypothetical protein